METFLSLNKVSMTFGERTKFHALDTISLSVARGEFVSLIGHSGCGKSTLLNLIAGLYRPSAGSISCEGQQILGPGPDRGVVFQNHSLLPWMTCHDNILLGVAQVFAARLDKSAMRRKVDQALDLVHLGHAANKYPHEISGGMKQRVGIARALAIEPRVLLLDEPFGALDALTRASLQDELIKIVEQTRSTVVMVTHDVDEAIFLSDRVVMMTNGPAAKIGEVLHVDIPRPRHRLEMTTTPAYVECRRRLLEFLYLKQAVVRH
ncbi:ABC transporter ATP-binding protein [Bosea vaviloviae]|uniref:Nitrate ABC transporter ATP-binding protein n=1 Tax=Bosea vaviloviae TaxID=1526658 RepID=A0A1D7UC61_9HYPH|nr:ABC transporter ATP-binding protein [Bosea vaviloviae]AOO84961.1 nitrate ABC transporter ATP-binding protein [Bosea vaviloviae]